MGIEIKVLGIGCSNCKRLYAEAENAIHQAGIPATLTKVETIEEIAAYKILATPALVINGIVKSAGRIPSAGEIAGWITKAVKERTLA
jgi:small redox-active disulfide protein 2